MKRVIFIAVMCAFVAAPTFADMIQYATGTSGGAWYYPGGGTVGTEFIVNQNLGLSKLGIYDYGQNGLGVAHDVALFAMDGTILASVNIGAGTTNPLENGYRWADASSVALVQGTHYVLGAYYSDGSDWFLDMAKIDPAFTLVRDLYRDDNSWAIPDTTYLGSGKGWYGPNLQAVPVPAAVLLGMLGLGAAGLKLRKLA
jgi:hypothetical protein